MCKFHFQNQIDSKLIYFIKIVKKVHTFVHSFYLHDHRMDGTWWPMADQINKNHTSKTTMLSSRSMVLTHGIIEQEKIIY